MKHFTIYNAAGEIIRAGQCPDEDFFHQCQPGEFITESESDPALDAVDPQTGVLVPNGRPVELDMDYRKARIDAYPGVREQLDMLWHAMDEFHMPRVEPFYSRIKAVKDAYPKDNSVVPGSVIVYPAE